MSHHTYLLHTKYIFLLLNIISVLFLNNNNNNNNKKKKKKKKERRWDHSNVKENIVISPLVVHSQELKWLNCYYFISNVNSIKTVAGTNSM